MGCITISFNVAAITAAIPVISLDLTLSDILVSSLIPYYLIPYGLGALIYAPLTRYLSFRTILAGSMLIYALASIYCGWIGEIDQMLIARILSGIAGASAIPVGLMIIGEFFDKKVRGRLVGLFFSCSFFASLAGIVLSGVADWKWLFYIPGLIGFVLVGSLLMFGGDLLGRKHKGSINYLKAFKNKDIRNVFIFIFGMSFLYHGVHKWFGVYLSNVYAMDKLAISFFFILMAMGGLSGQLLGGVLSDKKGRLVSCVIGVLGLSLCTVLLAGYYPTSILGIVLVGVSMFWTVGHNGVSTVLTDFPERDRPIIASLNSSVRFISGGLGFAASSLFVEKSFGATFFVIGMLMLAMSLIVRKVIPVHES